MALDLTCNPAIREELVRLRQADILRELDERRLVQEARSAQATSARRNAATAWHRHRPSRLVHAH